ncbi:hypothetical protein N9L68_07865 [bacterium]|nr:hypothetical protein [bacterium]
MMDEMNSVDANEDTGANTSWELPFVVHKWQKLNELVRPLPIEKWNSSFPTSKAALATNKCVAPMKAVGPSSVAPCFEQIYTKEDAVDWSKSHTLEGILKIYWWFGLTRVAEHHMWEPDLCGSIRVYVTGVVRVVMMSARQCKKLFNVEDAALADTRLADLKNEHYQKAKDDGLAIYHATLDTSNGPLALVTPAGYCSSVMVQNNKGVSGFKQAILPLAEGSVANLELLAKHPEHGKNIGQHVTLLKTQLEVLEKEQEDLEKELELGKKNGATNAEADVKENDADAASAEATVK